MLQLVLKNTDTTISPLKIQMLKLVLKNTDATISPEKYRCYNYS